MSLDNDINKAYKKLAKIAEANIGKVFKELVEEDKLQREKLARHTITPSQYKRWLKKQILASQTIKKTINTLAEDMANTNDSCIDIIEQHKSKEYIEGAVAGLSMVTAGIVGMMLSKNTQNKLKSTGIDVTVLDRSANVSEVTSAKVIQNFYNKKNVERIASTIPSLLPKPSDKTLRKLRKEGLKRWNRQVLNSQVLTGIRKGESMPKIAKRLERAVNMDNASSIRNARTAVNGVRNRGTHDRAVELLKAGIPVYKSWETAHDARVRERHRDIDGEEQEVKEPFSNKLMYPADPDGDPAEVYNCRCTYIINTGELKNASTDIEDYLNDY